MQVNIKLSSAEFTYNIYVNRTTDRNSHEIVDGFRPKQLVNIILIADHYKVSEFISSFASHVHELHIEVSDRIAQNNANYKLWADISKRFKNFNVGDVIKELHDCSAAPFQILKKLNDNAYIIDLLKIFDISSIFNVEDLMDFKGSDFNPNNSLVDEASLEPIFNNPSLLYLIQQIRSIRS